MERWQSMYQEKLANAETVVKAVCSDAICASTCALGEPVGLASALAERVDREGLTGVTHHLLLTLQNLKYLAPDMAGKMSHVAWFTSGFARKAVQEGRAGFMPCNYKDAPMLWRELVQADVFYATVSPMDKHGWFSFGVSASVARAQMSRAKKIFLEVNSFMPRTHGSQIVHISEVDAVFENNRPLFELPDGPLTEQDKMIGNYIADLIPNGATIQLGIGGMPNAVAQALRVKRDLGIHSEMFTEGMVDLIEAGVVTNRNKQINTNKAVASFAVGTKRMYDFLDDNPAVEFHAIDYVNDPNIIGQHDNFVSINATLEVDLVGQACSESLGPLQFSGTGGQVDFVRGAGLSKGGQSFLAMYSTAKHDTISKIKAVLTEGSHVTCSKNDIDCVVTEYGVSKLKGKTASQRAMALIAIAHPKFREELLFSAKKLCLIP
ncbi:4-hydroxybutyrate CoA-transferase [Anaerosporomusa subterranea]|uniref:4-hydroxybutyrate CoA-transferase n=1 Tax=Anaerosporomusa subterranea TaxID=1794912 RepID=A0A154BSH8_ANASB|nr:acetyl-CoA hydrolase/transferase C-terminal domain-containing protein [Anaerosporomusa subterranea]KYZ76780.1 4-hydroxybutyrate CoA-transferase [Anaerosporomusa subterranea]